MAHHKRKGPKSTRGGCLLCKPHKDQKVKDTRGALTPKDRRELERFLDYLTNNMEQLPPEFARILDEECWDLLA